MRSTTSRRRRSSSWNRCAARCRFGRSKEATTSGRVAQPQPGRDVVAGRGRGRRGQRDHRRVPEPLDHRAQPQVVGPEVVPPLGDAVRLVDDEQRDACRAQRLDDLVVGQLLGGQEHVLGGAVAQLLPRPAGLRRPLGGVDHDGVGRLGAGEALALVALQGDQRRDHDRRAVEEQGGHLVDRGLPRAGGQHREHVAALGERLHRRQLLGAQLRPAEGLLGDAGELVARSSRHAPRPTPREATPTRPGFRSPSGGAAGGGSGSLQRTVPPVTRPCRASAGAGPTSCSPPRRTPHARRVSCRRRGPSSPCGADTRFVRGYPRAHHPAER